MINNPIYDEIIIVGTIFNNNFDWYITNKLFWIMDLKKLPKNDYDNYFRDKKNKEIRKDIITLSHENIRLFLDKIKEYKVDNIDKLRLEILNRIRDQDKETELEDYYPSLMLDFDKKILYSQFPEPFGFENYIPQNWEGKYMSFIDYIEDENKYWIYKNKNLLI